MPFMRHQEGVRALAAEGWAPPTPWDPRAVLVDVLSVVLRTLLRDGKAIDDIHRFCDVLAIARLLGLASGGRCRPASRQTSRARPRRGA